MPLNGWDQGLWKDIVKMINQIYKRYSLCICKRFSAYAIVSTEPKSFYKYINLSFMNLIYHLQWQIDFRTYCLGVHGVTKTFQQIHNLLKCAR